MGFPLFKLGSLFVMSFVIKPITRKTMTVAYSNKSFGNFCRSLSKKYHCIQQSAYKRLNINKIPSRMTTQEAIEFGSEIVGEGVLILGTVGVLYYEWNQDRQEDKNVHQRIDTLEKKVDLLVQLGTKNHNKNHLPQNINSQNKDLLFLSSESTKIILNSDSTGPISGSSSDSISSSKSDNSSGSKS